MKSVMKAYAAVWAICLALFNAIVFLAPIPQTGGFWIGYVFITLALIGQLLCTCWAFKTEVLKKFFYSIPVWTVSYIGLAAMLVMGTFCMAIPAVPNWVGAIGCLAVLGITAAAVISVGTASQVVDRIDEKVSEKVSFIKDLTVEAECLVRRANALMLKSCCKKVYEALRYSDPVSASRLSDVEQRIREEFDALTDAVIADDLNGTEACAKELLALIEERNKKCRAFK